ncbi:HET-domain-containing protein [Xylaria sp. FL1777]|nr:HET-domain-containing protein [Xylaria sp. FL1777]
MHLINTQTLCLEEFPHEGDLKYAILSHRWEDGEVTFQDMESGHAQTKPGYSKIQQCCEQARRDCWRYAWVDTCCIDKKSSAELSEAINSMYRWYKRAQVCYAFLSDVDFTPSSSPSPPPSFHKSLWFKRGWTLQELLASRDVRFYSRSWQLIGTRTSLSTVISQVTKINVSVLDGRKSLFDCSIAERMSWAAHRETTRAEDRAYSLLGLFDINMPMLYGEGEKAFLRLQEEIIRHSDDHSIFAWSLPSVGESKGFGLLAPSPDAFVDSTDIRCRPLRGTQSPYTLTNKGVSITLDLTPWAGDTYLALLECASGSYSIWVSHYVGIFLRRLKQDNQYTRVRLGSRCSTIVEDNDRLRSRPIQSVTVYVKQNNRSSRRYLPDATGPTPVVPIPYVHTFPRLYAYRILIPGLKDLLRRFPDPYLVEVPYANEWDSKTLTMTMREGGYGTTGVIDISRLDVDLVKIKLGFDFDHNPLLFALESEGYDEADQSIGFGGSCCIDKRGQSIAVPPLGLCQEAHKGIWAIQGHRHAGVRVELLTSSRLRDRSLPPVHVQITSRGYHGKLIWELEITGLLPNPGYILGMPRRTSHQA